jgi:regulator of protease activity HflC (stomatin/prohibitin superfamily)
MPQGRVVALGNEVGIQARTLGPGLHFLIPFIYKANKSVFTEILENEIGLIEFTPTDFTNKSISLQAWDFTVGGAKSTRK